MKKPSKKQIVITENSSYIDLWTAYSPDQLRQIADNMERDGILFIECQTYYDDYYFIHGRMETESEAEKRYNKEVKAYEKYLKQQSNRKAKLIREAEALGLEIVARRRKNGN